LTSLPEFDISRLGIPGLGLSGLGILGLRILGLDIPKHIINRPGIPGFSPEMSSNNSKIMINNKKC